VDNDDSVSRLSTYAGSTVHVVNIRSFCFVEFNAVTQTCIQDLVPSLLRHLNLPKSKGKEPVLPSCSPQWKKIRLHVKAYVGDVIEVFVPIELLL